jgi:hypothetical protein
MMIEAARTSETLVNFCQTTDSQKTAIFIFAAEKTRGVVQ